MLPSCLGQFFVSVGTWVLALAALMVLDLLAPMRIGAVLNVGAGCLNGSAGTGMADFFHCFPLALMTTSMLCLAQFVWCMGKARRKVFVSQVHTPTLIILLGSSLVYIISCKHVEVQRATNGHSEQSDNVCCDTGYVASQGRRSFVFSGAHCGLTGVQHCDAPQCQPWRRRSIRISRYQKDAD